MEGTENTTGSESADIIQVKVKKTKIVIEDTRKKSEGSGTIRIKLKRSKSKEEPKPSHSVECVNSDSCVDKDSSGVIHDDFVPPDVSKPETIKILVPTKDGSGYEIVPIVLLDKPKCKIKKKSHGTEKPKQKEHSAPATASVQQGIMKQSVNCSRSRKPESRPVILTASNQSSNISCGREKKLKKTLKTESALFLSEKENQLPQIIFSGGHMFQSASTVALKDKQNTVNLVRIKEENPKVKIERKPLVDVDQKVIDVKPVIYRDLACVEERNRTRSKSARMRKTNPVMRKIRPATLHDIYAKKFDCDDGFHNVDDDLQDLQHILRFDARKLIPIELRLTDGSTDGSTNDDESDLYRYHIKSGRMIDIARKSYPRRSKRMKTKKPKSKKPDLGLAALIEMALLNSPEEKLTLNSICDWIMERCPYYKELDENKWRVAGGILLGVAIWIIVDEPFAGQDLGRDDIDFDFSMLDDVIYLMLTVGICLFLLGFLGCCGVCKSSRCMLISYCIMMIIIICLEVTAVGLMASFSSSLGNWMEDNAVHVIQTNYTSEVAEDPVSKAVNYLQTEKHCCGADDYRDYEESNFHKNPEIPVPYTCCEGEDDDDEALATCREEAKGYETPPEAEFKVLYAQGCISLVTDDLDEKTVVLYAVLTVIIFFQVILMVLVFMAQCCCINKDGDNQVTNENEPV